MTVNFPKFFLLQHNLLYFKVNFCINDHNNELLPNLFIIFVSKVISTNCRTGGILCKPGPGTISKAAII